MSYTYYDYLELAPGATPARIETAYLALLERLGYGATDAGQDTSGLVAMIHTAYTVLSNSETTGSLRRDSGAGSGDGRRRTQGDARPVGTLRAWCRVEDAPAWLDDSCAAIAA